MALRKRLFAKAAIGIFLALVVPNISLAAGGLMTPLFPQECHCDNQFNPAEPGKFITTAPDYGCILQTIQNLVNAAIELGIILCVVWLAWGGFSMMISGSQPEAISTARTRLLNAALGLLIILCAWLIVDFVMKAIYNPDAAFNGGTFGPWNSLLSAESDHSNCIVATKPQFAVTGTVTSNLTAVDSGGGATTGTLATGTGTGSCNPTQVAAAAAAGGYQLTPNQANALACIAQPESTCGTNTSGAKTPDGKPTSAGGPWQIIMGSPDKCHSLTLPACGNLNCSQAFSGGKVKSDPASLALAQQCQAAVNNLTCSAAAAACLIDASHGKFSPWTADSRSSVQKQCVTSNGLTY